MTGTDLHKLEICLVIVAGLFSSHCSDGSKFTIEEVQVHYERDEKTEVYPKLHYHEFNVELAKINQTLGLNIDVDKTRECAEKMGLVVKKISEDSKTITFEVPPIRSDIMHACDITEDIGIAYGYNNIPLALPPTNTIGTQIPQNKFSDLIRLELA